MKPDWNNLFKIRLANTSKSFQKHEIIKLLVMMKLIEKNKKDRNYITAYTEFPVGKDNIRKADVYFENTKDKECFAVEIQKELTPQWIEETKEFYSKVEIPFMNFDWIVIPLKEISNDIEEMDKQLDKYLV